MITDMTGKIIYSTMASNTQKIGVIQKILQQEFMWCKFKHQILVGQKNLLLRNKDSASLKERSLWAV